MKNGDNGYIQINQNISALTFTFDFGSVGNAGTVGFYTYTDDPANAIDGGQSFKKSDGSTADLGSFSEGQKIGFYLTRNNGDVITDFYFVEEDGKLYLKFQKGTNGKDEMILISDIGVTPSGQPLPGVLAALLLGGGITTYSMQRKRRQAKH